MRRRHVTFSHQARIGDAKRDEFSSEPGETSIEARNDTRTRRRRSALLSTIAAALTASFFVLAIVVDSSSAITEWLLTIGLPPVVSSVVAAVQYRRTPHTGAGAAAAVLYWVFLVVFYLEGGLVFVPGALLQTAAWFVSRPRSPRKGLPAPF
jgi:hypothetical protein